MKFPNAYFGNGPGQGEDLQGQRDQEAYQRNRLQMTVATSSFAGVALVGMFCSCLWFICCRNSSSKTRKKARTTWASAEAGLQNPYSYDGYLESQNSYMQMTQNGGDAGVAPYLHNPLYHPTTLDAECSGIPNPYDFSEHGHGHGNFGMAHHPQNGLGVNVQSKAQLSQLFGGIPDPSNQLNPKDVPPSYTALFFAANANANSGDGGDGGSGSRPQSTETKVTNIQPIHLKVTSSSAKGERGKAEEEEEEKRKKESEEDEYFNDGFLKDASNAPPVSLLSMESDDNDNDVSASGSGGGGKDKEEKSKLDLEQENHQAVQEKRVENPPPYNPGYEAYRRF